jgi:hypothetical protein
MNKRYIFSEINLTRRQAVRLFLTVGASSLFIPFPTHAVAKTTDLGFANTNDKLSKQDPSSILDEAFKILESSRMSQLVLRDADAITFELKEAALVQEQTLKDQFVALLFNGQHIMTKRAGCSLIFTIDIERREITFAQLLSTSSLAFVFTVSTSLYDPDLPHISFYPPNRFEHETAIRSESTITSAEGERFVQPRTDGTWQFFRGNVDDEGLSPEELIESGWPPDQPKHRSFKGISRLDWFLVQSKLICLGTRVEDGLPFNKSGTDSFLLDYSTFFSVEPLKV